ncbi:MAG TPA: acyltransferase [Ferruginibacter sp.]|jgi:peptidoglycan/LPS O-acetylase OafA/YrhL|nr:acyltransferase [Ferruginibacter sp.]
MNNSKLYFKNLDSIRFIACLMVFLQHGISESYQYLPIKNTVWQKLLNLISNGGFGVSIFFVLSGFLITYLLITEYELNSKISVKNFYIRRILRIWPLYFLVVVFAFLIYPSLKSLIGMNHPVCSNVFYYLTFLSNFDLIHVIKFCNSNAAMMQGVTWSVSIEEQFYLFWPLLFLLPKKTWIYSILVVISGSLIFRLHYYNDGIVLYFHTVAVLIDLGIGGLVAYLIKENTRIRSFFENSSTITHFFLFTFTFCLLFWCDTIYALKYGNAIGRIAISLSFALIIAAQALTKSSSILNLQNLTFANKWGKYTYGIYLIHPIALTAMDTLFRTLHIAQTNFTILFTKGMIGFVLTLVLSKISYIYFESKFLALKDTFTIIKTRN